MRFSTIVIPALFSTFTAATTEVAKIDTLVIRDTNSTISSASFSVQPANAKCSGSTPALKWAVKCGETAYRFFIDRNDLGNYNLTVYKQTAPYVGLYGTGQVNLICRAGGSSNTDYVCEQRSPFSVTISG